MFEVGRICTKAAGRDKGLLCVIVDTKDDKVLIDGQTRRRLVNVAHITPSEKTIDIKKGASHDDVVAAFKKLKIEVKERKPKQKTQKPAKKARKTKKTGPVKEPANSPKAAPAKATKPKAEKKTESKKSADK